MKRFFAFFLCVGFLVEPRLLIAAQSPWTVTNDKVGLNVHWALGAFGKDDLYRRRMAETRTTWVREHFATDVFVVEYPEAWFERYDLIMKEYRRRKIKVLGMLAYGSTKGDFNQPNFTVWENFVRMVVERYKHDVEAWEVWNEPDSKDYLTPPTIETYGPLLEIAYRVIKEIDPDAIVLNGGLASLNTAFAEKLFEGYNDSFDALAVHAYYCRDFSYTRLIQDLERLRAVVERYRPGQKIWMTELGCSTGSRGVDEQYQKQYLREAASRILETGFVEQIFLYNIRNYDYLDAYENGFGLLTVEMRPRPAWNWYRKLPKGPYNRKRLPLEKEAVKAQALKTVLEGYFGKEKVLVTQERWEELILAHVYGGYSVIPIVQAIRFQGKTVHPVIPHERWKNSSVYRAFIHQSLVHGKFIYAYGKARVSAEEESRQAQELREKLIREFPGKSLKIDSRNWDFLVRAYVYGGYPVKAIARAAMFGGKTVHREILWKEWRKTKEYQEYIQKNL